MQPIGTTLRVMTRVRDGVLFHTRGHIGKELEPQTGKETIVEHLISGQLMRGEELEEGVIKVEETKVEATGAGELQLDSNSFFHDLVPGVDNDGSGIVVALAAVMVQA